MTHRIRQGILPLAVAVLPATPAVPSSMVGVVVDTRSTSAHPTRTVSRWSTTLTVRDTF